MNRSTAPSGALEHRFVSAFECQSGKPDQVVMVSASVLTLDRTDLRFRETEWLILRKHDVRATASGSKSGSSLSSSSASLTLLQSCYQLQPLRSSVDEVPSATATTSPQDTTAYLRDFVVQAQSEKVRTMVLRLQTGLLKLFSGSSTQAHDVQASANVAGCSGSGRRTIETALVGV